MASFVARRPPPDARKFFLHIALRPQDFGFVWTLFNPLGSTGQASGIATLPVEPGLAAVADRAAPRLPKSPLTNVSIRHTGSLVRAGGRVFGNSPLFCRFSIPASSSASHSLATGHSSFAPAPPAGSGRAQTLPRWLLPSTDTRIAKDRTGPDLD